MTVPVQTAEPALKAAISKFDQIVCSAPELKELYDGWLALCQAFIYSPGMRVALGDLREGAVQPAEASPTPMHCPSCGKYLFGTQRCNWCGWNKTLGPQGGAPERFNAWFASMDFRGLPTREVASLAFDEGHAFWHVTSALPERELAEAPTTEQSVNAAVPSASSHGPAGLHPTGASAK